MFDTMRGFVGELRQAGVRVSMTECVDAMRAASCFPLDEREALKAALAATLVKDHRHRTVYEALFDVYFSLDRADVLECSGDGEPGDNRPRTLAGTLPSRAEVVELLFDALATGDRELVRLRARQAVTLFADFRVGGAISSLLYVYRTVKALDLEQLRARLEAADNVATGQTSPGGAATDVAHREGPQPNDVLQRRLQADEHERRLEWVRQEVDAEIRRLLVAAQGSGAVAGRLRTTLPEDADFLASTAADRQAMTDAVQPLARSLAAQLAIKRHRRHGAVDVRRTIRRSLAYGGTPAELIHRRARPAKPQLMVLADVSGSVMMFARFALHLLNALQTEFTRVRSFAFVDSVDEISSLFQESDGIVDLAKRVNDQAQVVWLDGRSDYGNSLETFWNRWGAGVTARTTVLVLGDARNNYHAAQSHLLGEIHQRARSVVWLNPEPEESWNTGDSLMAEYGQHCDLAIECRNLRQLRQAIGRIVE